MAKLADAAALDEMQAAEADRVGTRITVAAEAADAYVQVREFQARLAGSAVGIPADRVESDGRYRERDDGACAVTSEARAVRR